MPVLVEAQHAHPVQRRADGVGIVQGSGEIQGSLRRGACRGDGLAILWPVAEVRRSEGERHVAEHQGSIREGPADKLAYPTESLVKLLLGPACPDGAREPRLRDDGGCERPEL